MEKYEFVTLLHHKEQIALLTGTLMGLRYRVDQECWKIIEDALAHSEKMEGNEIDHYLEITS